MLSIVLPAQPWIELVSFNFLFLSGIILSGSIFKSSPNPVQSGHAPKGLLKENILGVNSSILIPQSGHA
ncbi:hypothetical protein D3C71_1849740 [compost metagenome]